MKNLVFLIILCSAIPVYAGVDLPWSTTFDCNTWTQSDGYEVADMNCDGMYGYGAWLCGASGEEQITSDANHAAGDGGRGQRHLLGDGKNDNSGGIGVTFNTQQTEVWIRFYVRFQSGFVWNPSTGYKILYIWTSGADMPFYVPLYTDRISVYTGTHDGCDDCSWTTYSMSNGNWNYIELHMKRETIAGNDGLLDLWINGNHEAELTNVSYNLIGSDYKFTGFLIGSNADSPDNNSGCWYVDYDDIAVNNTGYIGPLEGSGSANISGSNFTGTVIH